MRCFISALYIISLIVLVISKQSEAKLFVTLGFDDTFNEHYEVSKTLEKFGMRGTFYMNSRRIAEGGRYLNYNQAHDMQRRGHNIASHTANHANLTALSPAGRYDEICGDAARFRKWGFNVTDFAFPFSNYKFEGALTIPASCGLLTTRMSGGLGCAGCPAAVANKLSCTNCLPGIPLPSKNLFPFKSASFRPDFIDFFIQLMEKGQIYSLTEFMYSTLVFHTVGDTQEYNVISYAKLGTLLAWITAQGNIAVVTPTEIASATTNAEYLELYNKNLITKETRPIATPPPTARPTFRTKNPPPTTISPSPSSSSSLFFSTLLIIICAIVFC